MKKPMVVFFLLCLSIEVVTSLWVWTSQPSHGLVDVYEGSFIKYETSRLLPWTLIVVAVLFLLLLARKLPVWRKSGD
jgi:hypothetical protein